MKSAAFFQKCLSLAGLCLLALFWSGCHGAAQQDLGILKSVTSPKGGAWDLLLEGKTGEALEAFEARAPSSERHEAAWRAYGLGEAAALLGEYETSARAHFEVVGLVPDHPLAAWSLLRLKSLEGLSAGFYAMAGPALEGFAEPQAGQKPPGALTRYLAGQLALSMAGYQWPHANERAPFDGSEHGVPSSWKILGPTSVHVYLDIDRETAPEADPEFSQSYVLRGFERRATTHLSSGVRVTNPSRVSGVYVAETFLKLSEEVTVDLAVEMLGLGVLFIDGQKVFTRDDRDEVVPVRAQLEGLRLSPGVHRILFRVGHEPRYRDEFGLMFLPRRGVSMAFSSERPSGGAGRVIEPGRARPWIGPNFSAKKLAGAPVLQSMMVQMAAFTRNEEPGVEALELLEASAPKFAGTKLFAADLYNLLASVPGDQRRVKVQRALTEALESDPSLSSARLRLASMLRKQGLKEATQREITALTASSDHAADWLEAARWYNTRRWFLEAEAAWKRALELDPGDCYTATELYRVYRFRDFTPSPSLMPAIQKCFATRVDFVEDTMVTQGSLDELYDLRERAVRRRPDLSPRWHQLVAVVRDHRSEREALETIEEALVWHPEDMTLVKKKAGLLESLGEVDQARQVLLKALERYSGSWALRLQLSLMDGELPLADLLADGEAAIKAYDPKGAALNSAAVYVLDYMARRHFEDGSSADVTHLVIKVLAKEGVDKYGEVTFPGGAIPLMIRTVKANGVVVEAKLQQGKSTVSMPSLEVGDHIEYAYLSFNNRYVVRRGAAVGPTFYFQMAKIASAHSELVIEVPDDWEMVFESRHGPPTVERETRDGRKRYRWLRKDSAQPRPEPDAVVSTEFLPHVGMVHRYGWTDNHRSYQNSLRSVQSLSPALVERAREVVAGADGEDAAARALFRFVTDHVREPSARNFSTRASHVEQSGEGSPMVLLQALLKARGIASSVYLIKSRRADPVEGAVPSLGSYSYVALKAEIDGEVVWLYPGGRYAPYGVLPSSAQGQPAICIEASCPFERITSPSFDPGLDRRDVHFEMTLDVNGALSGTIVETLRGGRAAARRGRYDEMSTPDKMRKFVQRFLNSDISGGQLVDFEIGGLDDPAADLTLTIEFTRPDYAVQSSDGRFIIEDRFDLLDMTRRYGRLSARTIPLMIPGLRSEKVSVSLTTPVGWQVDGPEGGLLEYASDFGDYDRSVEQAGNVLKMSHRLELPLQRIDPISYPAFRQWSGDIDRATYVRIALIPQ